GGDQILAGETSPIGSGSTRTAPVDFWHVLLCVDSHGRRIRGRAARAVGCGKRKRLPVTGVAHHPYTRGAGKPLISRQTGGSMTTRASRGRAPSRPVSCSATARQSRRSTPTELLST